MGAECVRHMDYISDAVHNHKYILEYSPHKPFAIIQESCSLINLIGPQSILLVYKYFHLCIHMTTPTELLSQPMQ